MCYTDLRPLYVPRGLAELAWPYSDDEETRGRYEVMEYPVGISYWACGTAWVTQVLNGSPDREARSDQPVDDLYADEDVDDELKVFVLVNAVGFAALALLAVWLLSRVNPGRPWDAAAFAALADADPDRADQLGPDRGRAGGGGALGLVAGPPGADRRTHRTRHGGEAVSAVPARRVARHLHPAAEVRRLRAGHRLAAVTWAPGQPARLPQRDRRVEGVLVVQRRPRRRPRLGVADRRPVRDSGIAADTINVVSWIFFGVWCVGVLVIGLLAGRRTDHVPRLAQLGFLIVAGFLLVNKVYSPQYVLWLLPLAVLARPRWRDQIIWQAGEVFYFCTVWWYLGGYLQPAGGGDVGFYWVGIAVRMACELYLVAVVVRDMFLPHHDPVQPPAEPPPDDVPRPQPSTTTRSNVVAV